MELRVRSKISQFGLIKVILNMRGHSAVRANQHSVLVIPKRKRGHQASIFGFRRQFEIGFVVAVRSNQGTTCTVCLQIHAGKLLCRHTHLLGIVLEILLTCTASAVLSDGSALPLDLLLPCGGTFLRAFCRCHSVCIAGGELVHAPVSSRSFRVIPGRLSRGTAVRRTIPLSECVIVRSLPTKEIAERAVVAGKSVSFGCLLSCTAKCVLECIADCQSVSKNAFSGRRNTDAELLHIGIHPLCDFAHGQAHNQLCNNGVSSAR